VGHGRDGNIDLAVANSGSATISVLFNQGNGIFGTKTDYGAGSSPRTVFPKDLDLDGDQELAVVNSGDNTVSILKNLSNTGCFAKLGDLDHDCSLTLSDIVLIINCVFLGKGNCPLLLTDVNCDGILTSADVVLELNKAFLGSPFPCQ